MNLQASLITKLWHKFRGIKYIVHLDSTCVEVNDNGFVVKLPLNNITRLTLSKRLFLSRLLIETDTLPMGKQELILKGYSSNLPILKTNDVEGMAIELGPEPSDEKIKTWY